MIQYQLERVIEVTIIVLAAFCKLVVEVDFFIEALLRIVFNVCSIVVSANLVQSYSDTLASIMQERERRASFR